MFTLMINAWCNHGYWPLPLPKDQQPDMSTGESSQTVTPRFEKKKRCVSRENLLEQAEKLMDELAANKALLEIHYKDEVCVCVRVWVGAWTGLQS